MAAGQAENLQKEGWIQVYSKTADLQAALRQRNDRLVLAESCTAGLVASELGKIPGISECFCGSMVVYRTETKHHWLGIDRTILEDPAYGPVSEVVTQQLANAVLERTPEATIAAAITGHLGPGAPPDLDGLVFCAVTSRQQRFPHRSCRFQLASPAPASSDDLPKRVARQQEAANLLIGFLLNSLGTAPNE